MNEFTADLDAATAEFADAVPVLRVGELALVPLPFLLRRVAVMMQTFMRLDDVDEDKALAMLLPLVVIAQGLELSDARSEIEAV